MASLELQGPDVVVCPLLGLAADPRSHFTFPHSRHRCYARRHPAATDTRRQATYCLSSGYIECDRYRAQPRAAPRGGTVAGATTVVHPVRAGDSLSRIAAAYGLTVEQIATANGLTPKDLIAEGTRLVIPLGLPSESR